MSNSDINKGWRKEKAANSLNEVFSSIKVPANASSWKKFMAYVGPGLLVAVGYMDPGNWATDIAGGAQFGYTLLSVILISNLFAIVLQYLSVKLGIVAERDLAQACKDHFHPSVNFILWIFCEIAIAACDLAEVIGSAIALNLLFGIPLSVGVVITVIDVFLILFLQSRGFRYIESIVGGLIFVIFASFLYEIFLSKPDIIPLLEGLIPKKEIITNPSMLYIAIGILGATVMPHNLYLHSSIVQTRDYPRTTEGKKEALKFASLDSSLSLMLAFFINAAILIISAATFHTSGNKDVADINDAYKLLSPLLGTTLASIFFGVALLASGQNSTVTGTLAGQIVMEGFLNIRLKPWVRRLITRLIAIIPALIISILYGERGTADLLVFSQVILSMQLSFAVVPLVMFTGNKTKMGQFVNKPWLKVLAWTISGIIIVLNLYLLKETIFP
ncbi:Nramp family divalent metal transporter [Epilithonimonas vandammei]|uniref:Divalent metal cation transporter MntH n=1 Tax=Epilithonimonas vandammei TaxID=2487072 RepID=A0A3G8Y5X7_9FLAO|nr:Nramp family divalent metal transporter [Epilithonimonas vandammei]AZI40303.1 divalent metal cation transporter [Epilithonimonas vandammei]